MSDYVTFLVTVLYGQRLIKCALKINKRDHDEDKLHYFNEPESVELIWSLLPRHVRSCGKIVEIQEIFECHIVPRIKEQSQ